MKIAKGINRIKTDIHNYAKNEKQGYMDLGETEMQMG